MKKRIFALVLSLCMVLSLIPATAFAADGGQTAAPQAEAAQSETKEAVEKTGTVLAFTSDVHNGGKRGTNDNTAANRLATWISKVEDLYGGIDAMAFGGDMGSANYSGTDFWDLAKNAMDSVDSKITQVHTTGNHEYLNGSFNSNSTTHIAKDNYKIDEIGDEGNNYIIYCLGSSSSNQEYTYTSAVDKDQIEKLTDFLSKADSSKVIFIITHFPLHYISGRETGNAIKVIEALNSAVNNGKTIVFLWGHNHTNAASSGSSKESNYDRIFKPNEKLTYASGSEETIQFYYAAAGCMSDTEYSTGSGAVNGKGLVAHITENRGATLNVDLAYYDESGNKLMTEESNATFNVKASGSETNTVSGYVITIGDYALSRTPSEDTYTSSSDYHYTGFTGVEYHDGDPVTTDILWNITPTDGGYYIKDVVDNKYLNATYIKQSGANAYDGTLKLDDVQDVWTISDGVTLDSWKVDGSTLTSTNCGVVSSKTKSLAHETKDEKTGNDINLFTIRSTGGKTIITEGEVEITEVPVTSVSIDKTNAPFSVTKGSTLQLKANVGPTGANNYTIAWRSDSESVATVTNSGKVTGVSEGTATITVTVTNNTREAFTDNVTVTVTGLPRYELATSLEDDEEYLIVSANSGSAYALKSLGSSSGGTSVSTADAKTSVTIQNDEIAFIEIGDSNIVWTASAHGDGFDLTNNGGFLGAGSRNLYVYDSQQTGYWTYSSNNELEYSGNSRYLYYYNSNYFYTSSSSQKVYLFKKAPTGPVALQSVSLPETANLSIGGELQLTPTFNPSNATNKNVTWASNNEVVATVDSNGRVTPHATGTAVITVTTEEGSHTASCTVTVTEPKAYVITIDDYALSTDETDDTLTNSGSGSQVYSYTGLAGVEYTSGSAATNNIRWNIIETTGGYYIKSMDGRYLNATYEANSTGGSTGTLKLDNTPDVWVLDGTLNDWIVSGSKLKSTNANKSLTHEEGSGSNLINLFTVRSTGENSHLSEATDPIAATNITVNPTTATVLVGGNTQLTATVTPNNATGTVVWTSSDETKATVDSTGKVRGVAVGASTITATIDNLTATCVVTVDPVPVESVALDKTTAEVMEGKTLQLTATVLPENATDKTVTWTSSNPTAVSVDNTGKVTGNVVGGTATITATAGEKSATCEVTVTEYVAPTGCVIMVDGYALSHESADPDFFQYPNTNNNYYGLKAVAYDSNEDPDENILWVITPNADGSYTITDQSGNYLNATYSAADNGDITGRLTISSTSDKWTLDEGIDLDNWLINASKLRSDNASTQGSTSTNTKDYCLARETGKNDTNIITIRSGSSADDTSLIDPAHPVETIYVLSNTLTAGEKYLIVNTNSIGSGYALGHSSSTIATDGVTINAGKSETDNVVYIDSTDVDSTSVWSAATGITLNNGTYYMRRSSSNALKIDTTNSNRSWTWTGTNNTLANGNYYLRYSDNTFSLSTSTNNVYLFVEKKIESTSSHTHTYGTPTWSWEDDYSSATATFTCTEGDDTQTVTTTTTPVENVVTLADCTHDKVVTYTATVTFNGADYSDTTGNITVEGTALGHLWDEDSAEWTWTDTGNGYTASVKLTCTRDDSHTTTETAEVVAVPGSEDTLGQTTYTATVTLGNQTFTDTKIGAFYLVGTMTEWKVDAAYRMKQNEANTAEYILSTELTQNHGIKAVYAFGDEIKTWYPDGAGNDYIVETDYAGTVTVYFMPSGNSDWSHFGGYIYISKAHTITVLVPEGHGTAAANVTSASKETTITITAEPAEGYEFDHIELWRTNGGETAAQTLASGVTNFSMPDYDVTVKVFFKLKTFTVTFVDEDGETVLKAATEYDYGTPAAEIVQPATPTKAATAQYTYTFAGWTPELAAVTENVTYKATYSSTVNKYTVTFVDENEVTVLKPAVEYDYGTAWDDVVKPADPTKTGYRFTGWTNAPETVTTNVIVKASYTINQYTITFYVNEGDTEAYETITENYGTAITAPAAPTKTGYTFKAWSQAIPATMPAENLTINATWTANTYKVVFNANGGTGEMDDMNFTYDVEQALTANTFAKENYHFAGWNTQADGNGTAYNDGAEVKNLTAENGATVTLYAIWTQNAQITVTFKANGGTGADKTQTMYKDVPTALDANTFTRTGYTFAGWATSADGAKVYDDKESVTLTEDTTLFALWTKNTFAVEDITGTFTYNGQEQTPEVVVKDGTKTLVLNTDYTVEYTDNTNAGTAKVTVTGKGNYAEAGSVQKTFTIDPKSITGAEITLGTALTYTGSEQTQTVTSVTVDGLTVTYTVSGNTGTNAGDYTLTVTGTGNFTGTATKAFTIAKADQEAPEVGHTDETISGKKDGTITGLTTAMEYSTDDETYTAVTATYLTGLAPGTYYVRYKADDNHNASPAVEVVINASTKKLTVTFNTNDGSTVEAQSVAYNEKATKPATDPTKEGYTFGGWYSDADLTTVYDFDTPVIESITLYAKWSANGFAVEVISGPFTYTGKAQTPEVVVKDGTKTLVLGTDYTVAYSNNIKAGTATVTVTGKGNYAQASDTTTFVIGKAPLTVTAKAKTITYGDAPANDGVEYSGFVNGETATVVNGTVTYTYSYQQYGNVGSYDITPAGLTADNYEISFAKGTLTVAAKEVGLTWSNTEFAYDSQNHVPTATATGLVNNDTVTVTVSGAASAVGTHTATATALSSSNYKLPGNVTTTFTITKGTQAAPTEIGHTNETISGKKDGTITGLAVGMEYSADGGTTWTTITAAMLTNGALTGLAPGTYKVRYAENNNYNASEAVTVTIEASSTALSISGGVTSFIGNKDEAPIFIELYSGTTKVDDVELQPGNNTSYRFSNVAPGEYTIKVAKADHATRTYTVTVTDKSETVDVEIHLMGDLNGDGKVTTIDFARAYWHACGVEGKTLSEYEQACADVVEGDGITNADALRINQHVRKINPLW